MNPFSNFKIPISSRRFARRYQVSLFILLCSVVFLEVGMANITHLGSNKNHTTNTRTITILNNNKISYETNLGSNRGEVNPLIWGINAPDKDLLWAGNKTLEQRISSARIKIVRVGAIQYANYVLGHNMCTSPTSCDFSAMDAPLKTIFDAGAEPLFVVVAYPGGIAQYAWQSYAIFMQQVVRRYNVDLALGEKIRYWELWNEPTSEPDGTIPTRQLYEEFIKTVGGAMKSVDSTIKLIAPAAPYADLGSGGWLSYVAQNTNNLVDVLSWHDYGGHTMNDQTRLTYTRLKYYDNIRTLEESKNFVDTTSGKRYGAAITEYNMAGQPLADRSAAQFHNNYNAVYVASAIINAMKAKAQLFTFFTLAQSGTNLLGILDPSKGSYSPFKPYYTFYIFGNHMGTTLLDGTGDSEFLEYIASKSPDGTTVYIIAVNKNVRDAQSIDVNLNNVDSGNYRVYELDASINPLAVVNSRYQSGHFKYILPPLSVTAFEISV
jgi:hypothetical protein